LENDALEILRMIIKLDKDLEEEVWVIEKGLWS
jgi:hypothetical protein